MLRKLCDEVRETYAVYKETFQILLSTDELANYSDCFFIPTYIRSRRALVSDISFKEKVALRATMAVCVGGIHYLNSPSSQKMKELLANDSLDMLVTYLKKLI